ncbi:MAG: DUF3352 domain-containing protein [Actinomycetota bacterium]|nr:DUF3352 domain-containing protein [Actinomycetota bacterium]
MADSTQGPHPHPGQTYGTPAAGEHAPTEWLGSGDPPRDRAGATPGEGEGSGRGGRRGIIVGAAVAVVVLLAGGAVFAFQALNGGGPQPAEAVPSSAIGFLRVDLDPSADQKMDALALLRRVPQFEEETGITSDTDDLRKRLFELALDNNEDCSGIDYADDIEPWLGDRAGVAAIPAAAGDDPDGLVVLQVSDEDAAREGLQAVSECGFADMPDAPGGVAFVGEYALLAETQELADGFAAAAEGSPLSADADYTADLEALDGEGIASAWVDLEAVVESVSDSNDGHDYAEAAALAGLGEISSVAMSLRANSDSLEVAVAADGVPAGFGDTAEAVQTLPDSTLFAHGFAGGSDLIEAGWAQLSENLNRTEPGAVDRFTRDLETSTGLQFPDDLQTLVGDDFALSFDGAPLVLDPATGEPDLTAFRFGVRTSSDIVAVADLVTRVEGAVGQFYPLDLYDQEVDGGGSVIALDEAYADDLAAGGDLGESANYQAAVADPQEAAAVTFVDFDRALTLADQLAEQPEGQFEDDEREGLKVLRAFGLSVSVDGDYTTATERLVFD